MLIGLVMLGVGGAIAILGGKIFDDAWRGAPEQENAPPQRPAPAPIPAPAVAPPPAANPDEEARRMLLEQRGELERAAIATKGTPLTYQFDDSGIGRIEVANGDKHHSLQISKCSATAIWVSANNNPVKWASVVKFAEPGKLIDVRTLRHLRDASPVEIGQRAFFEMDDGSILQIVVVGMLYYNAGDDKDEVRIKYRMYDAGQFLIEPL